MLSKPGHTSIRIELVDDHAVVRSGLRLIVESRAGWIVVAEAGTAREAVAAAEREQPDVILLDLDLGADRGLECLPLLRQAAPNARILILTGLRDSEVHQQAVRLGATGVILKDTAADYLLRAIECVNAGESWLDRLTTAHLLAELAGNPKPQRADPQQAKVASLSDREREVIALVTTGLRNRDIAERLHISEATVRHHLTAIFAKLEVSDRLGLTIYALQHPLPANRR